MTIEIEKWIKNKLVSLKKINKEVCKIDKVCGAEDALINVSFVTDKEMKKLNMTYRGKSYATDVLSFTNAVGDIFPGTEHILGDIVIALGVAKKQADDLGHSLEKEIIVLLVHGITHLYGFDHENSLKEAIQQMELEMSILEGAGFSAALCLQNR